MAADEGHSENEPRLFCIGRSGSGGILTVRFTYRGDCIRIIGAGHWRKGRRWRKTKRDFCSCAAGFACGSEATLRRGRAGAACPPAVRRVTGRAAYVMSHRSRRVPHTGKSMKKRTVKYTGDKGEIAGDLRPVKKDELPSLDELVGKL